MPSAVPAPLACIAERLQCPVCFERLAPAPGSLACARGHTFDVARQGYVALLPPVRRTSVGDDGEMVAARAGFQAAGHFEPLTAVLTETAGALGRPDPAVILDVGAGPGHHLAVLLDRLVQARGVALDVSCAASRRAARAHHRIAAVRGDVWQRIPVADGGVDLVLSVFAPRNGTELARVLRRGGVVVVATPAPQHLHELAPLHAIGIDPRKPARLPGQLGQSFRPVALRRIEWTMTLTRHEVEAVLRMGPSAKHLRPDAGCRLASLREPVVVTGAVEVRTFGRAGPLALAKDP